jgi:DMSO reductase anchor subunit
MHPAYSVIVFTTASGAGYGLLFWLGLATALGAGPGPGWPGIAALTLALALVTLGLLSSTFHLGHPERAWRALSQWRTSWLSREGVLAVATYLPAGLWWLGWVGGFGAGAVPVLAALAALGAVATVWSTAMIYASLRTVRQWNRGDVAPVYLSLAAATGALVLAPFAAAGPGAGPGWAALAGLAALAVAAALKWRYWAGIDADPGRYTAEQATGLGALGQVRPLDPPHTQPNFVMREMGYSVARRHALTLRRGVMLGLFALPAALVALALALGAVWPLLLALPPAIAGVLTERWLFFAEAEHVSQLYYGRARA